MRRTYGIAVVDKKGNVRKFSLLLTGFADDVLAATRAIFRDMKGAGIEIRKQGEFGRIAPNTRNLVILIQYPETESIESEPAGANIHLSSLTSE